MGFGNHEFTNCFASKAQRHKVARMGFTQSSQGSKDFAAFPFGGLRGLPLPYSLFLLSYYLFFPRHEGARAQSFTNRFHAKNH